MSQKNYLKRMMLWVLFIALLSPMSVWAQSIQLTGVVTDASNEPIIGASVVEKGTTNGVITDFEGNFSLNVSAKATIVISYVGYQTQEIAVNGQSHIKTTLKEEKSELNIGFISHSL